MATENVVLMLVTIVVLLWDYFEQLKCRQKEERNKQLMMERRRRICQYRRQRRRVMSVFFLAATRKESPIVWSRPRSDMFWKETVWRQWVEEDWKQNLRMTKRTFLSLYRDLRPALTKQTTKFRVPINLLQRVAKAIWRLSGTSEYRTIAHLFGIGRATAHRITREVCDAISRYLFPKYVTKPTGRDLQKIIDIFEHVCGLPQAGGAIDGTHIEVTAPTDCPEDYVNRRGYHSLQVQALVDSSMKFIDIFAGYPESVHDARVFSNSPLYKVAEREGGVFPEVPFVKISGVDVPAMILGDSAYPLLHGF